MGVQCSVKGCPTSADVLYRIDGRKYAARCRLHDIEFPVVNWIRKGKPCICNLGVVGRFRHVDGGRCFRCGGSGFWRDSNA